MGFGGNINYVLYVCQVEVTETFGCESPRQLKISCPDVAQSILATCVFSILRMNIMPRQMWFLK